MTAQLHDVQHHDVQLKLRTELRSHRTDPLGPITLPQRNKVGARATALVGTVGLSALAVATAGENITWPTI